MTSPYAGIKQANWAKKTAILLENHPINNDELIDVIRSSWKSIFKTSIGTRELVFGKDIVLPPQFIGSILERLISREYAFRYPKLWSPQVAKDDKDLVCLGDSKFSCEIKTSSSANRIYGNRSYAQPQSGDARKSKDGYYIGINFEKMEENQPNKKIKKIWFGWLDHTDWKPQASPTGQQASLPAVIYGSKLVQIYSD